MNRLHGRRRKSQETPTAIKKIHNLNSTQHKKKTARIEKIPTATTKTKSELKPLTAQEEAEPQSCGKFMLQLTRGESSAKNKTNKSQVVLLGTDILALRPNQ